MIITNNFFNEVKPIKRVKITKFDYKDWIQKIGKKQELAGYS